MKNLFIVFLALTSISSFEASAGSVDRIFVKKDIPLHAGTDYVLVGNCVIQLFDVPNQRAIFANTVYEIKSEETILGAIRLPAGQGYGKIYEIDDGNVKSINCERTRRDQQMSLSLVENTSEGSLLGVYSR